MEPYAVICGESLNDIKYSFFIVGTIDHQISTHLAAVDLVSKYFKALQKDFSRISNHVWYYIESQVYDFSRTVSGMIEELNKW